MNEKCPQCGAALPAGALAGLCPACLLKQGAAADTVTQPEAKPFQQPSLAEVSRLFPQLEVISLLGKGGMGAVYKARQKTLDRLIALKILPIQGSGDAGFGERFSREARALARLNHPNIVALYEFGQVDGWHYFIMEYVDGVNLRQLQRSGMLAPREALQIVPQICDALQYAHDEGVVHRDIKPENVLVDRKRQVKIADFGLAKILGRPAQNLRLTGEGQVMGTPHYMAPEQMEHPLEVDHRADIFSLGVVFYEMLTGELPLGKFAPPSQKVQIDVRVDEVVMHALEKEPQRRYQHVSQVKTDVLTITEPPKTQVLPPPAAPARKRRLVLEVAGLAAALVLGGVGATLLWLNRTPGVSASHKPAGLVAQWHGDGNLLDAVGNNNGVPHGGVTFGPGRAGKAFSFDGKTGYIEVPSGPTLKLASGFTVEGWINYTSVNGQSGAAIATKGPDSVVPHEWILTVSGASKLRVHVNVPSGWHYFDCATTLVPGAWYHVAMVYDGSSLRGYVNGVLDGTQAVSGPVLTTDYPLRIGAYAPINGWFPTRDMFWGSIDELSLYNRPLSDSEIRDIYVGAGGTLAPPAPAGNVEPTGSVTQEPAERGGASAIVRRRASPRSLVAQWRAEGTMLDGVGNHNGIAHGNVSFAPGRVGKGFNFDGRTGYIEVPSGSALKLAAGFTIEGWINYTGLTGPRGDTIIAKGPDGEVPTEWTMTVSSVSKFRPAVNVPSGWHYFDCATMLTTGVWYHVAMVYDGSNLRGYVNGVLDGMLPVSGPVLTTDYPLRIGAYAPVNGNESKAFFWGSIDELSLHNRPLSDSEIKGIYTAMEGAPGLSVRGGDFSHGGPVAQWHAEGTMLDAVGKHNGIAHGGVSFAPGHSGKAFDFDGESGYIEVPSTPAISPTGPFTVEGWVRYTRLFNDFSGSVIFAKGQDVQEGPVDYTLSVSHLRKLRPHIMVPAGWTYFDCETTLDPEVWYHVAMVYDGANLKGYVNGALDGMHPVSGPVHATGEPLTIGVYAPLNGGRTKAFWAGQIDELAIYDRALSDSEVQGIYRAGGGTLGLPERTGNVIARWHADGNGLDSAGKNDAASLKGVVFAKGVSGQAFSFNGDGASVNIPRSPALADVGDQVTVECWINVDADNTTGKYQGVVASDFYGIEIGQGYVPGGSVGVSFFISTDGGATWPNTADANGGGVVLSPGQWHHVAGTCDGAKLQLYVDGQPQGRPLYYAARSRFGGPGTPRSGGLVYDDRVGSPPASGLPISPMKRESFVSIGSEEGRRYDPEMTKSRYFQGLIDEVAIYNRALAPKEIIAIYRAGTDTLTGRKRSGGPMI